MYYIFKETGNCISSCTYKPNKSDLESRQEMAIESDIFFDITKIKAVDGEIILAKPTLEELKTAKITKFKAERNAAEVEPIEYNGNLFDYDDKARDRISAAIVALEFQGDGASLAWTAADNTDVTVTVYDLKNIIAAVAARSNALHIAYRTAKAAVLAATTKEELDAIVLE